MQVLNLINIPSQSLSARLDEVHTTIRIKQGRGIMLADIEQDGAFIVQGMRLVAGLPIIPLRRLESGNFMLLTDNGELPDYTKFGISQKLIYINKNEVEAIRNGTI